MQGTLDIRKMSNVASNLGLFQIRYEDLIGNSFVGSMGLDELRELLYHKLPLDLEDRQLDQAYDRLVHDGHMVFPEITMKESELVAAGLRYLTVEG